MTETLTHKDLSQLCGVSETTIKSYRRKFPTFIPIFTEGKPIRFKKDAGEVCLAIRDCFTQGMSVNETHKVLKEKFKEYPSKRKSAAKAEPEQHSAEAPMPSGFSEEYLKKFFETAGQMMHGMAQLATAQAKADRRLEKLEQAISSLADVAREKDNFQEQLLDRLENLSGFGDGEKKVRAKKIVNVREKDGHVQSYSFENKMNTDEPLPEEEQFQQPTPEPVADPAPEAAAEPTPAPKPESQEKTFPYSQPSDTFMETPIVIRNEQGEFLGVPGKLALRGFIEILEKEAQNTGLALSTWERRDKSWVYSMRIGNGDRHELYFGGTKTPRKNLVVLLWRLDVNGKETSPAFLQEFFRQIKDKIQ